MTGTQITGQVTKRDGSLAPFSAWKIRQAITAASQATGEFDAIGAQHLTSSVVAHLAPLPCPDTEIIQNCVEEALMDAGY